MKKNSVGEFEVARGEQITVQVTPFSVGPFVAAARDGNRLTPDPATASTRPTFNFTVNNTSVLKMEFSFPGAPATAKYVAVFKGSEGGESQKTVKQTTSIKDPDIVFRVV